MRILGGEKQLHPRENSSSIWKERQCPPSSPSGAPQDTPGAGVPASPGFPTAHSLLSSFRQLWAQQISSHHCSAPLKILQWLPRAFRIKGKCLDNTSEAPSPSNHQLNPATCFAPLPLLNLKHTTSLPCHTLHIWCSQSLKYFPYIFWVASSLSPSDFRLNVTFSETILPRIAIFPIHYHFALVKLFIVLGIWNFFFVCVFLLTDCPYTKHMHAYITHRHIYIPSSRTVALSHLPTIASPRLEQNPIVSKRSKKNLARKKWTC